ncbi:hypothetical protein D9R14_18435 [Xanthobacter tagetidis]|uniref:ATP-dependent Clp protease proteolytic subunit n=2 Tax=Xanthobacter tagetidis TaxID=60216 RepID=A0A3L7A2V2_9HYPH|nr:hypothetical protein D9R14_18435 [Xanthobacter tagetidis]
MSAGPASAPSSGDAEATSTWARFLGVRPDETVLRTVFRALMALTIAVLGWDLAERMTAPPERPAVPGEEHTVQPYLPSARPGMPGPEERRPGRVPAADLRKPMVIELVAGGRLEARGAITPGTAERFAAEIARLGDYVKTVVLNSPGGSVSDALAMGRLIRERRLDTKVEASGLCVSSCPLVFVGGVNRIAEGGSAIGVHQVFTGRRSAGAPPADAAEGMAGGQRVSAECQRHLVAMGVDPRVWMSAMETPPQEMFYFSAGELLELKLATAARS